MPSAHSVKKLLTETLIFSNVISFPTYLPACIFSVVWHCRGPVDVSQPRWQISELLGTGSDWPPWHVFSKQMVVSYYKSASVTPSSSFIAAYVFSVPLYHSVMSSCIYDNKNCPLTSTLWNRFCQNSNMLVITHRGSIVKIVHHLHLSVILNI